MRGDKDTGRCWTCRKRKTACDKERPFCQNCLGSNRECLGYEDRLTWPEPDTKRAIVGTVTADNGAATHANSARNNLHFLHLSYEDLVLHDRLADSGFSHPLVRSRKIWQMKQLPRPMPLSTTTRESNDLELIQYYESRISKMVSTVSDKQCFSILMQMSFHDRTPASQAVVQSICALSCLHQFGQDAATRHYDQAVATLISVLAQPLDVTGQLQCVMAAMFLGLYEIFSGPDSSYSWMKHIWSAKAISIQVYNSNMSRRSDLSLMLDWVYYHDVFTKFSLSHYNERNKAQMDAANDTSLMNSILNSPNKTKILGPVGCSVNVLVSISEIFDIVYQQSINGSKYKPSPKVVDKIERSLKQAEQILSIETADEGETSAEDQALKDIAELFRLAALIYLHRAVKKTPPHVKSVKGFIREAFVVLKRIETCDRTFPIFIVGCEAREEEQRQDVLRVFKTTEERSKVGNVARVRKFVETLWLQDDLDERKRISYTDKITAALSTSNDLPSFT